MKILSWNINGIRAVYKNGFIQWLTREDPDIIGLQETKAEINQLPWDLQYIPGYKLYLNPAERKGYSGTGVFTKKQPEKVETKIDFSRFDREGRIQICRYDDFTLINLYVPNGSRDQKDIPYKLEFYKRFIEFIKKSYKKNVILMGDFNIAHKEIDLARPEQNKNNTMFTPKEREQIQKILDVGFLDTFRMFHPEGGNYSWLSYYKNYRDNNIGWRIDYIFVSENLKKKVKDAYILRQVEGSDHVPIGIEIAL